MKKLDWLKKLEDESKKESELRRKLEIVEEKVENLYDEFVAKYNKEPKYMICNLSMAKFFRDYHRESGNSNYDLEIVVDQLKNEKEVEPFFKYIFRVYGTPLEIKFENSDTQIKLK